MQITSDGLQRYQISWIDTIKHVETLPEVRLCANSSGHDSKGDAVVS